VSEIKIIEHISPDGMIQAPGNPNEDPPYPYGGWNHAPRTRAGQH